MPNRFGINLPLLSQLNQGSTFNLTNSFTVTCIIGPGFNQLCNVYKMFDKMLTRACAMKLDIVCLLFDKMSKSPITDQKLNNQVKCSQRQAGECLSARVRRGATKAP